MRRFILTVRCPDRVGIVAAVTGFIAHHGGWVLEAAQHGDLETGQFFQRIEVAAESLPFDAEEFSSRFAEVAESFDMQWHVSDTSAPKRVVLLASRDGHCAADLLHRWRSGDFECDVTSVISNHADLQRLVEWFGIPFIHLPVPAERKREAFDKIGLVIEAAKADVIVLARFMQVLPNEMCARYAGRIINIHHSFLPAFSGARAYHQAFARGVKLIGATCHYVTDEVDAGPIIEQATRRVGHADTVERPQRIGREIESSVLARGLRWHLEDRVLLNGNRTVVFA